MKIKITLPSQFFCLYHLNLTKKKRSRGVATFERFFTSILNPFNAALNILLGQMLA